MSRVDLAVVARDKLPKATRVRAKAPLRLSFCGGGTDVLPYAAEQGGCVLNATIDRYAYATLTASSDVRVHSRDLDLISTFDLDAPLVYDGKLDLVKAMLAWLGLDSLSDGFDLYLHTDAPPGSGLGSSSAVVVAMIDAFARWFWFALDNYGKAALAYQLERDDLGIQGGMQDQYSAVFGGFNFMEFNENGVVVNPLRVRADTINELEYAMVLCYTGGTRNSADIISTQNASYTDRDPVVIAAMGQLKQLAVEMKSALVRGKLSEFGGLLNEAWMNKKCMAASITTPEIEDAYGAALGAGAIGGKISGAGGGGFMYFYCPGETRHKVSEQLERAGFAVTPFSFEPNGVQTWAVE